jgi:nucleotide-binding universal stress UspA family protein
VDEVKHILVVSSSPKYYHKAIQYGVSLAEQYGSQLYIMHVVHDPFNPEKWNLSFPYPRLLQEEYRKMQQKVKKELV